MDKSTAYVDYVKQIVALFPQAYFILLFRNGMDQAHSATQGGVFIDEDLCPYHHSDDPILVSAVRRWNDVTLRMLEFQEAYRSQCFSLRYEDICRFPEKQLRPLFEFLGESWEPSVLEFYKVAHDKGREDARVRGTRGFSISEGHYLSWSDEILDKSLEIAGSTLAQLGYAVEAKPCL